MIKTDFQNVDPQFEYPDKSSIRTQTLNKM